MKKNNRSPMLMLMSASALCLLSSALLLTSCDDKEADNKAAQAQKTASASAPAATTASSGTTTPAAPLPEYLQVLKSGSTWFGEDQVVPEGMLSINYYFILDGSGSMGDSECSGGARQGGRMTPAKVAVERFVAALPDQANVGLYVFDAHGSAERVPLGHGAGNRAAIVKAVENTQAGGNTPLGASLNKALESLRRQAALQSGYGEYNIVVTTDGEATDPDTMERAVRRISATPVVLQTVGFCLSSNHALNSPGRTVYRDARNPAELERGLSSLLAESEGYRSNLR